MKKLISVCLCICIFAAQLSGCSDMSFPGSSGPTDAEKLEKIRTSDEYPEILVETAEKCPQTLDYVYNYPELKDKRFDIDLSADAQSGAVPLFIQWDERWGYAPYGSGFIGTSGCGPTCRWRRCTSRKTPRTRRCSLHALPRKTATACPETAARGRLSARAALCSAFPQPSFRCGSSR